jgi:uncharacterized protein YidB (DUF937 family)
MTALLGLLAIAGYQNRDKLAELLKNAQGGGQAGGLGGSLGGGLPGGLGGGLGAGLPGGLGGALGGLLGGLAGSNTRGGAGGLLNGGLGELLESFRQNGQGDVADSWVSPGPNKDLSSDKLKSAIGPDVLSRLTQQTGLSEDELLSRLSRELPNAVDKYTPDGRIPDPDDFDDTRNPRSR